MNIIGAGVGTLTSLANSIVASNAFRIHTSGSVTIAAGNQIITLRLYAGPTSTLLVSSYAITLASLTGSPPPYNLQTMCTYKSVGSTGSVQINRVFTVNDASTNQTFFNQNLATIDTTVDNVFRMTVQWTTADTVNVFIVNQCTAHNIYGLSY